MPMPRSSTEQANVQPAVCLCCGEEPTAGALSLEHWPSPCGFKRREMLLRRSLLRGDSRRCPGSQSVSMAPLCRGQGMSFSRVRWYQLWPGVKTSGIPSSHRRQERLAVPRRIVEPCTVRQRAETSGLFWTYSFRCVNTLATSPQILLQTTGVFAG